MPHELSQSADAAQPLFLLEHLGRRLREAVESAIAHLGITAKHYRIAVAVLQHGPMTQQRIGTLLEIDRTTMVKLVDDLERQGLAFRDRHPTDGRAWEVDLTPEGELVLQEAVRLAHAAERELIRLLDAESRQTLKRISAIL